MDNESYLAVKSPWRRDVHIYSNVFIKALQKHELYFERDNPHEHDASHTFLGTVRIKKLNYSQKR
jgi:hypothetical protein